MKKNTFVKPASSIKPPKQELKPSYYILLMAYVFVSVLIPNFYTLDSNAPKFLAIAILNLISLLVFFTDSDYKKRAELQWSFFKGFIGIVYLLFLIISLLSFFSAINLAESVVNISKIFTVFTATYVLYVIFNSNKNYLKHVALALVILLLIDCFTVFYNIAEYIIGKLSSVKEIKSLYSNKNIFASALFVKLPIAIWLMYFSNGWQKRIGYLAVFFAILATLFLSTRAFYLGLGVLLFALVLYAILRYAKIKKKEVFAILAHFAGLLIISILIFFITQRYIYPTKKDIWSADITSKLSTIDAKELSAQLRLTAWQRSYLLIREHPIIGVGTGNWRLAVLKYENKESQDFFLMNKNHNDFIEITAETGIFGGLAYLSIFFLIIYGFIRTCRKAETDDSNLKFLFLPALGIVAYSVDAFFNFPADRPEIQILFAIYIASAAAYYVVDMVNQKQDLLNPVLKNLKKYFQNKWVAYFLIILLCATAYVLMLNVKSSRYQRYYLEDKTNNTYTKSASYISEGFPSIPNISCINEPIVSNIAYYLVHENKNREAIDLLMMDNSSPYDSRREFYLSVAYSQIGMLDSAIIWGQKARLLKPLDFNTNRNVSIMLLNAGLRDEAMQITSDIAKQIKNSVQAWMFASNTYWQCGQKTQAVILLDSAIKYLPNDTTIAKQHYVMKRFLKFIPYDSLYNQAMATLNAQQYTEAIKLLTDFINKKPEIAESYQQRAVCYYNMRNYTLSILDIEKAIKKGDEFIPNLLNLRGLNNLSLGKKDAACVDFKTAMDKGDADATLNYQRFCDKKE